jgi:D-3-phosphoglycerate dehydrogenase / 2-oxoglutarate reductase
MSDVVVLQPIARSGVAILEDAGLDVYVAPRPTLAEIRNHLSAARAVITRNHGFSEEELAAAPCLRVIAVHGTGMDKVAHAAAAARGITVVNTPGVNARSVAELALGLMLACAREIPDADEAARTRDVAWRDGHRGIELGGRRLGLLGFGHVARALVPMARGLGMEVSAFSRHTDPEALRDMAVRPVSDIDALCADSDVLSLHTLPGPRPLIDAGRLARMPRGAILVNTARGALVDEAALAAALASGHLRGAALDVTVDEPLGQGSPLLSAPRLVLTPHIGGAAVEAMERAGQEVARRLLEALEQPPG